jgi:PadR family transcriptional regulator PadR
MANTNKSLYFGLIHLHLLDYACREPLLGAEAVRRLEQQGYRLSPDTIYDLLRFMEKMGWLRSRSDYNGGRGSRRRVYLATSTGRRALEVTRPQVKILLDQLSRSS